MTLTPLDIIIIIAMLCIAAFVQGYGGFGYGIVSMTLLSFLAHSIERLSIVVSLAGLLAYILIIYLSREHGKVHWRKVLLLLTGIIPGLYAGYWFIDTFGSQPVFRILLGVILIAYAVNGIRQVPGKHVLPLYTATPIGMLSGFISGAFVSGGPPLVIYLYSQTDDPREMKGTIQAVFFSAVIFRLLIAGVKNGFGGGVIPVALYALPFTLPVVACAHLYSKRHSSAVFKKVVNILIGIFGIVVLAKALIEYFK